MTWAEVHHGLSPCAKVAGAMTGPGRQTKVDSFIQYKTTIKSFWLYAKQTYI